jgi:hypothetical protein
MTTEGRFLPNASTQNRSPDSKKPHRRRHQNLVCISWYQRCHSQKLISAHAQKSDTLTMKLGVDAYDCCKWIFMKINFNT